MALEKNNVVVVEHEFAAPVAKVFEALKAGRLFFNCGAFPDKTEIDFRTGGLYRLDFGHHGTTYGKFTEILENKRVAFTWASDDMGVKETHVTIDLVAKGQGCLAKLRQEGFESREIAEMHEGGWKGGLTGFDNEVTKHRVHMDREFLAPVDLLWQAASGKAFFAFLGATEKNATIDFRVGGRYKSQLENGRSISGEFLEIQPGKLMRFTWEAAPCGVEIEKTTTVTVEFGPWGDDGKNSYLSLTHEGFTTDEATLSHHEGWTRIYRAIWNRVCR